MKAFKGCVNPEWSCYKKKHYKKSDQYCLKCGEPLHFVCAECWKVLEDDQSRYCSYCEAARKDRREDKKQAFQKKKHQVEQAVYNMDVNAKNAVKKLKDANKIVDNVPKNIGDIKQEAKNLANNVKDKAMMGKDALVKLKDIKLKKGQE